MPKPLLQSLPASLPLRSVAHTDSGRRRRENQDSYCVVEGPDYCFYAIADGMGGVSGGSVASGIAIATAKEHIDQSAELTVETLRVALEKANAKVFAVGNENPAYKGMGTTFVALGFVGENLLLANVGDSRAYRLRNGNLTRLTEDHTFGTVLQQTGVTSSQKAEENPMSHLLYRSVGPAPTVEADCWLSTDPPQAGDLYLICTDGLYTHLKDYEIAQTLGTCPIDVVAKRLISIANDRGGKDNVTVIAIQVRGPETAKSESPPITLANLPKQRRGMAWRAAFVFALGLVGGFSLAQFEPFSANQLGDLSAASVFSNFSISNLPPAGMGDARAALSSIDVNRLIELEADQALPTLQDKLAQVREAVEVATRKLSIWHQRREQFFRTNDVKTLAAEVAVTSPTVKEHLDTYRHAQWEYLRQAEELIYQPSDKGQEHQVLKLSEKRDQELNQLRAETQRVIDHEVSKSLYQIRLLSSERDKLQSGIESLNRKIGKAS